MRSIALSGGVLLTGLIFWWSRSFEKEMESVRKKLPERNDTLIVETFTPSVDSTQNFSTFKHLESNYFIEEDVDVVWNEYTQIDPTKAWVGPINHLRIYKDSKENFNAEQLDVGSVVLLDLHLFKKKKLSALFQIRQIDHENKIISFCYGKKNISKGVQIIHIQGDSTQTEVIHETYYKSNSGFRDVMLYPIFHEKCINEFHSKMHSIILEKHLPDTSFSD